MGISIYFYKQTAHERDVNETLELTNGALEKKLQDLEFQIAGLQNVLDDTTTRLEEAIASGEKTDTLIATLKRTLQETSEQLVQTQEELRETRVQLERAKQTLRNMPPPPPPVVGVGKLEVEAKLNENRLDLATCLREWSERNLGADVRLDVRMQIGPDGVPLRRSIQGPDDRVMNECVVGVLENPIRFLPKAGVTTFVELDLLYKNERFDFKVGDVTAIETATETETDPSPE